jgi:signal transduction histidine kinase
MGLLTAIAFLLDVVTPLGVTAYVAYIVVIMLSLWLPHRGTTLAAAGCCSALLLVGLHLSPAGGVWWMGVTNRTLTLVTIWLTVVLVLQRKRLLDVVQGAQSTLEARVAARTAELTAANAQLRQAMAERQHLESQLRHAQKMQALGTLASGIAHEFNNILAIILGFTQLTQRQVPPESPVADNLRQLQIAGQRAQEVVQQILAFSRPTPYACVEVRAGQIVHEAMQLVRPTLPKSIELRVCIGDETSTILADATQLEQVVLNLCANAVDAMRETGGVLKVHLEAVELTPAWVAKHPPLQPGQHLRLTVRDSGCGMTPEIREHIFEPFFTTKGAGEGTGMGLAIVHGIVTRHGGIITVKSSRGQGTTFCLYFPRYNKAKSACLSVLDTSSPDTMLLLALRSN